MFTKLMRNKHFRSGVPFILTVIGGSFGLKYYSQLRYDIYNERHIITKTKALQSALGVDKKKQTSLEEEYEEYKEKVDLDNWQNVRGPRPWEDDNPDFKKLIEKRAEESKRGWVFGRS